MVFDVSITSLVFALAVGISCEATRGVKLQIVLHSFFSCVEQRSEERAMMQKFYSSRMWQFCFTAADKR